MAVPRDSRGLPGTWDVSSREQEGAPWSWGFGAWRSSSGGGVHCRTPPEG